MIDPLVSIIIPTRNRPELLRRAVGSALAQTARQVEVVVVDDASDPPVDLPEDPLLRVVRHPSQRGGAAGRNTGLQAARGRWVAYLDDDDELLPIMVEASLEGIARAKLPSPVAAISGIELVSGDGRVVGTRLPPTRPRGDHFFLEPIEPGLSYLTKQTLLVEAEVLRGIGGWDESFRSRVHSELFLRLNPSCSLVGLPVVTYRLSVHEGPRVSRDRSLRQESFRRLVSKHRAAFEAHPVRFAEFAFAHADRSAQDGQFWAAAATLARAARLSPRPALSRLARLARHAIASRGAPGEDHADGTPVVDSTR
jgi:glycosyltransferase involved in cell wall biosynthesis